MKPLLRTIVGRSLFASVIGLGAAACGGEDPPVRAPGPLERSTLAPPTNLMNPAIPAPPVVPAPNFVSAEQCGRCHTEIYAEWKASYHGQAMVDPLFLELSADVNKEECIRCHAPVPLREVDFQTPIARTERREDAISCLSCHQTREGGMAGPFEGLRGACNPVYDPDQRDVVKMCFGCHNQHDTGNEWLAGPWSPEAPEPRKKPATTCLDCHMPEVDCCGA